MIAFTTHTHTNTPAHARTHTHRHTRTHTQLHTHVRAFGGTEGRLNAQYQQTVPLLCVARLGGGPVVV
jgi:hypothetical protein